MKALVDRLSGELTAKYVEYVETFMVDLSSDVGAVKFRCGFSLRRDHRLRRLSLEIPALAGETDEERALLIVVIFDEIEGMIDEAIAERRVSAN